MKSTRLAGLLWMVSASLGAWLVFPCYQSVVGALGGCLVATIPIDRGWSGRATALLAVGLGASLMALIVVLRNIAGAGLGLPPETSILTLASVVSFLTSLVTVLAAHLLSARAVWAVAVECALYAMPWLFVLGDHRQGHLDRPTGLVEEGWSMGIGSVELFAALGLILGVLLTLLLASRRAQRVSTWTGLWVPLVALAIFTALPGWEVSRLPTPDSGSPASSSAEDRIDKKTPDAPVAVIVFYQDYDPEFGVYHFRKEEDEGPSRPPAPDQSKLRYRVAELKELPWHLLMGDSTEFLPVPALHDRTFARVYELRSRVESASTSQLLETTSSSSRPPAVGPYASLATSVVPAEERAQPVRAALRLKLWMEKNRAQGEESASDSVAACLLEARKVGQKTYAEATQALMKSLSLETRLVHGYAAAVEARGQGSFLLLTERNQRWWPEVFVENVGWVAIDTYPMDAPHQADDEASKQLQRRLGELARQNLDVPEDPSSSSLSSRSAWGFLLACLIFGGSGLAVKLYRSARPYWSAPERQPLVSYVAALDRLAEVGEVRRSEETRLQFATRMKDRLPSLEPLTLLHLASSMGRPGSLADPGRARDLRRQVLSEVARAYPARKRWMGHVMPFAWMRVR